MYLVALSHPLCSVFNSLFCIDKSASHASIPISCLRPSTYDISNGRFYRKQPLSMNGKLHAFLVLKQMVIDLLATFIRFFLFVRIFLSEITLINSVFNTGVIT